MPTTSGGSNNNSSTAAAAVSTTTNTTWQYTMLCSTVAGMVSRIPCHPIDTCKSRMQASQLSRISLRSMVKTIYQTSGWTGFYRGFGVAMVGSGPATCLYLTCYEVSKSYLMPPTSASGMSKKVSLLERYPSVTHFLSGFFAETVSCMFWVPIDLLKERLQVLPKMTSSVTPQRASSTPTATASTTATARHDYYNTFTALRAIWKKEGFTGFYKGYGSTLVTFGPYSAFMFVFFEELKLLCSKYYYGGGGGGRSDSNSAEQHQSQPQPLPFIAFLTCSAISSACASFLTNPLDLVKLRLQIQRRIAAEQKARGGGSTNPSVSSSPLPSTQHHHHHLGEYHYNYKHFGHGLAQVLKEEGFAALSRGAFARMCFAGPYTALTLTVYEYLKSLRPT